MIDLMSGLGDVKVKTADALRASEADNGASVVLVAVVREFDSKAEKANLQADRCSVAEDEADRIVGEHAPNAATSKEKKAPSQATLLVEMAEQRYELGCTGDGEPYAVPKDGPLIVRQLRGGRQSLRAELAAAYYDTTGAAASQGALADACLVLEGQAHHTEPVDLHLRVAEHHGQLVLDLGDATGRAVVITAGGWRLVDRPPVLFRRTALTGALPEPRGGGDLSSLWVHVNVAERYRPVVVGVLVAELMPRLPHPVVLLTGEQGTGKTTATKRLAAVLDPSPAQVRKAPRDVETWTTAAAGSWVVALDNLSSVPEWLSDAICRASTGDADVRRRLYSDGDLHVLAFRRAVLLNGIDIGAIRGDLADRLVHLALERIVQGARRKERELDELWAAEHPKVLGALLDLTARVMTVLPETSVAELPRMADFALVLAALDAVRGTNGLDTYRGLAAELAHDVVTSDPVLVALAERITQDWVGTSAELLTAVTPGDPGWRKPRDCPSARGVTSVLHRQAPALRRLGWTVEEAGKDPRSRALRWHLAPPSRGKDDPSGGVDDARNVPDARNGSVLAGQDTFKGASEGRATPQITSDMRATSQITSEMRASSLAPRSTLAPTLALPHRR